MCLENSLLKRYFSSEREKQMKNIEKTNKTQNTHVESIKA